MNEPTPAQALILWCLLARHGRAAQAGLVPAVGRADREALAGAGLIAVEKIGRALTLTVTDRGWHWASGHLRAPLPPAFGALQDWLARMHDHLDRTGETLAGLVGPAPRSAAEAAPERAPNPKARATRKAGPKRAGPAARPRAPGPRQLRARIEAAYLALTAGARARAVPLSALRAALPDLDRTTLDAGLARILKADATARLSQISDPKALTPAEREAAYSPAGEPFHILWIQ